MKNEKEFETIDCNLCNSKTFKIIYPEDYSKEKDKDLVQKFRASGDELLIDRVVECVFCGLNFINPRIKGNIIVDSYSQGEDQVFVSQANAREKTFFKSLETIEKYARKIGKILDVGTAGGSFLAAAKGRGWEVYGCEPNRWLADWGGKRYGFKIIPGTIFDGKYEKNFFDVVTLWDVIEHTPDPLSVLRESNRILKNGGLLVVNYPDIGSWIARLMGRKWLFLTSVHLFYFNRKTIKIALNRAGFKIIKISPHFQTLELGYVLKRAGSYSKVISKIGIWISEFLGIEDRLVPYWLGQTFVLAVKE